MQPLPSPAQLLQHRRNRRCRAGARRLQPATRRAGRWPGPGHGWPLCPAGGGWRGVAGVPRARWPPRRQGLARETPQGGCAWAGCGRGAASPPSAGAGAGRWQAIQTRLCRCPDGGAGAQHSGPMRPPLRARGGMVSAPSGGWRGPARVGGSACRSRPPLPAGGAEAAGAAKAARWRAPACSRESWQCGRGLRPPARPVTATLPAPLRHRPRGSRSNPPRLPARRHDPGRGEARQFRWHPRRRPSRALLRGGAGRWGRAAGTASAPAQYREPLGCRGGKQWNRRRLQTKGRSRACRPARAAGLRADGPRPAPAGRMTPVATTGRLTPAPAAATRRPRASLARPALVTRWLKSPRRWERSLRRPGRGQAREERAGPPPREQPPASPRAPASRYQQAPHRWVRLWLEAAGAAGQPRS